MYSLCVSGYRTAALLMVSGLLIDTFENSGNIVSLSLPIMLTKIINPKAIQFLTIIFIVPLNKIVTKQESLISEIDIHHLSEDVFGQNL